MMNKKTKFETMLDFLAGKGFYIILFVCVAAIAVSGYILLFGQSSAPNPEDLVMDESINWLTPSSSPVSPSPAPSGKDALGPEAGGAVEVLNPADIDVKPTPGSSTKPTQPPITPQPSATPAPQTPAPTAKPSPTPAPAPKFMWPVSGEILKTYAHDDLVYSDTMGDWRAHVGVDIEAGVGTEVMACADGVVKDIYEDPQLGTCVVIEHKNSLVSLYASLQEVVTAKLDETVRIGDVIGGVGQSALWESADAPHLHFEMFKDGKSIDPFTILPTKN